VIIVLIDEAHPAALQGSIQAFVRDASPQLLVIDTWRRLPRPNGGVWRLHIWPTYQENTMPHSIRRLVIAGLLVVAALAGSAVAYSQVSVRPVPVEPVVLSGSEVGFRMTARKGDTPVGQLVVRVDGQWREVEYSLAVKLLTK
jgi:hypothetical protein